MTYSCDLMTCEIFLVSGIKCDTYETDSPKAGIELFNYFTMTLKTLCKTLLVLFVDSYAPFRSLLYFLIRSRIFNVESLALIF